MSGLSSKLRQWKFKLTHDFLVPENVVLVVAVVLCLTWTYKSIESMTRNWELAEQLNADYKNLALLEVEVEMAELENEYYRSDEYQELMARKLANKQLAGEHLVSLPENSEAAKNKHVEAQVSTVENVEKSYNNFEQWMLYLFPTR